MAEAAREGGKLNAFISYNDLAFADQARYGSEVRRLWANPPQRLADLDCLSLCGAEVARFGTGPVALVSALNTDHDWLREHTRYLRLAKEWGAIGKATDRRLLSARDIALAKAWTGSRPGKARH